VFLDRDGVLVEDITNLTRPVDARILDGVPDALAALHGAGFLLVVVTNQPVVARGMMTEADVEAVQATIWRALVARGAPALDAFYFCPHHPKADVPAYRAACDCRKPRPGMLLAAQREHGIAMAASFLVGDRITDIIAGQRAGVRTVQVETGMHTAPLLETPDPIDPATRADHICDGLPAATRWILAEAQA
jgi:D-glycero-D-manno-heptose 1,7-bisphosphate phosphatase